MRVIQANTMLNLHKQQPYLGVPFQLKKALQWAPQPQLHKVSKAIPTFTLATTTACESYTRDRKFLLQVQYFVINTQISVFIIIITTQIISEMSLKMLPTLGSCCTLILSRFLLSFVLRVITKTRINLPFMTFAD